MDAPPARLLRFGDFELDVRAGELRKLGLRIRLQDQSFQILLMLLERGGEVVLREEIRQKLWPNNTIVEFDHSINAAIKRLRNALSEMAEEPRYIETLAKRGYRFIGQVSEERKDRPDPPPIAATPDADDFSGQTFSHFHVLEKLGSGGMGVVYRAEDLKLGRQVALKFLHSPADELPASVLERFEREARAASALNHPHICTVHSVDNFAGQPVIVMELVQGETLEARLARGRLPFDQAVAIAVQMAGALAEAHRKGIVHRDLKPANVMLTRSGMKVLDFGLAKMAVGEQSVRQPGIMMGTLRYMSPEQAQGKETDARTDIFSFGVLLYEMISGKRPFPSGDFEPEPPPINPPALDRVVRRCLKKDPDERWQSAQDLKTNLEWLAETSVPLEVAPKPGSRHQWLAWGAAAVAAMGLAIFAFVHGERPPAPIAPVRFQIPAPENITLESVFSLSPDSRKLAFKAAGRLWVHFLESGESRDLTAAEGVPFWSPDSRFIGYPSQGKIKKIDATGGPPQIVADLPGSWGGGAWNSDDVIVFGARELYRVPASGGVPVPITALDSARKESMHFGPSLLPDGHHFVYIRRSSVSTRSATYLGSVDSKPEQQSSTRFVTSDWQPMYASSKDPGLGYLLFVRGGALMAQPFDNRRMELRGQPSILAERVSDNSGSGIGNGSGAFGGWAGFSTSANDVLVFQRAPTLDRQLTWYDRTGKAFGTVGEPAIYQAAALSPDGTRLAVSKKSGQAANIWLLDLSRDTTTRFTFSSAIDTDPVWSPDGRRLIFASNRNGPFDLYQKPADGGKEEELLLKSSEDKGGTSWSSDGRFLLYIVIDPQTKRDIWVLPLEGDKKPVPFLNTQFNERNAHFSSDGRWVAYNSDESGHMEVYVRSFSVNSAGTAVAGGKWQISNGDGMDPSWRGDGRELFYWTARGVGMAVEIATNPEFKPGKPQPLGISPFLPPRRATADGQRFLMPVPKSNKAEPYTVVMNWQTGLKK